MEDSNMGTISKMRNDFKKYSWTLWLVILAFVVGFIIDDAFRGDQRDTTGLIYLDGDTVVQRGEYQLELMRTLRMYKEQSKNIDKNMINQLGIPERLLENIAISLVIDKEADKLNITASESELQDKILHSPSFQRNGQFIGMAEYRMRIERGMGLQVEEFENKMKEDIIREKFQELVTNFLVISPDELREKYKNEKDQAELDFILLNPDRITETFSTSDTEIQDYYNKNKQNFKSTERRAGQVIALKFDDFKKDVTIEPKAAYEYFMKNKNEFHLEGKIKVSRIFLKYDEKNKDEVYNKIKTIHQTLTKDNFSEYAKNNSEDPNANNGGDYGYQAWQNFTNQEKSLINSMKEFEISPPINTLDGYSILYISEKISPKQQSFDDVKDNITKAIIDEKVRTLVQEKLQKIHEKLDENSDLKAHAEKLGAPVIETELLTPRQPIKNIDEMGYISNSLFGIRKEKAIQFPVQFPQGMAIIQLTKIEQPTIEPLDKVKDQVTQKIIETKKLAALKIEAENLVTELNNSKDNQTLQDLLKNKNLELTPLTYHRGNRFAQMPTKEGLDDQIFSLPTGSFSSPIEFDSAIAIIKTKTIKIASDQDFQKEQQDFYSQKINELKQSYFASYIYAKRESYKITFNQELFEEIKEYAMSRF